MDAVLELPQFDDGQTPRERADAARNRLRILEAAAELVARARHRARLDGRRRARGVRRHRHAVPPLRRPRRARAGAARRAHARVPGRADLRPAAARARASRPPSACARSARATSTCSSATSTLLVVAEPPGRVVDGGPYSLYATHLAILLREAAPHVDAEFAAQALLATLRPAQHLYARRGLGWSLERVRSGWCDLVDALSATDRAQPGDDARDAAGARQAVVDAPAGMTISSPVRSQCASRVDRQRGRCRR